MSFFKSNFMNLVEAFLQDNGFRVDLCTIYTKGVDYYESYKRIILCAEKGDLLLCIKAMSGETSDPFTGSNEEIEEKLKDPALKLLSSVRALNLGIDSDNCKNYQNLVAVPLIINEKASKQHPVYYYYDGETRTSKNWFRLKNVVFIPWKWMKANWNVDFEESLLDQGLEVSKPTEYKAPSQVVETIKEIENIISSRRLGILKSVNLNKPSLPPLVVEMRETNLIMIFLVDEEDEMIHSKLMDFAISHYGTKTTDFPTIVHPLFFNLVSGDDRPYVNPYIPQGTERILKKFEDPTVIKTTTQGFKELLDVATIEELFSLPELAPISDMRLESLLKTSSGYYFDKVFIEAKGRLEKFIKPKCPFCDSSTLINSISQEIIEKLNFSIELSPSNSEIYYCDSNSDGCGVGLIIINDIRQGGIHGFHTGDTHTYSHDYTEVTTKIKKIGLDVRSFVHIDLD